MKRLIFFLLLVGIIAGVSCLLLFEGGALDSIKDAFESIKAGTWPWESFNFYAVYIYGLFAFFLINAVLILSLLVMGLTTMFRFARVYRFYATMWWFLFSAALFTLAFVYYLFELARITNVDVLKLLDGVKWVVYVPLVSAMTMAVVGTILKKTENI